MDEVPLTAEEADLANAIRTVDAELDAPQERERRLLGLGMRAGAWGGWTAHRGEDSIDEQRKALLQKRADLAVQLRRDVEGG